MQLTPRIQCALAVARQYPEELMHLEQVARLSERLFDALQPLHQMGQRERELLCCAALLHDIGLRVSISSHHRHSLTLILESDLHALAAEERRLVANVARYHRKAAPSEKHPHFRDLPAESRELVRRLAAILRIADGLDRAHENAVSEIEASPAGPAVWTVRVSGRGDLAYAAWGAMRKADLFGDVYGVKLRIEP
jgi:exopolyphosphatase/guanosine-5'-triphosphate,3'-diphosphate pyrophosphatase